MSSRSSTPQKAGSLSGVFILALVLLQISFLFAAGGGQAGLGLLFIVGGCSLFLFPPGRALPTSWLIAAGAALFLCLYPFIPGLSFLSGSWRREMSEVYGISSVSSLTAQPWITLDSSILLLFGLVLFCYWSLHAPDAQVRRQVLRLLGSGMVFFAVVVTVVYHCHLSVPDWNSPRNLGPFENRNQLSSLLALSLLVLTALLTNDLKNHRSWALFWVLGVLLHFYLLVLNFSRGGVILFFVGGLIWLVFNFKPGNHKGLNRLALGFIGLAVLLSSFLLFGGDTLSRFSEAGNSMDFVGSARLSIQQDALSLVEAQPVGGVGLGNFAEVFPQYRKEFQSDVLVKHPESDWLWLMAETGIPGVLTLLGLVLLWAWRVFPLTSGTDKHFRSICLVAVVMALLHGLVDVPMHRVGVAVTVLFLATLALPPFKSVPAGLWAGRGWKFLGVAIALWGTLTLGEVAGVWSKPGDYNISQTLKKFPVLWKTQKWDEGVVLASKSLESAPLNWELYYWRATFFLKMGDISAARDDFRRARFFEKTSSDLPKNEALQWLPVRPDLAVAAASEMLSRSRYATEVKYREIADEAKRLGNEEVMGKLRLLARSYPELYHYYLETAPEEDFDKWLNDDEQSFPYREAYWFWGLLRERKSDDYLLSWAQAQPDRLQIHYRRLASILAEKKEWQRAFLLMKNHMPAAILPEFSGSQQAQDEAGKKFLMDPVDFGAASEVIQGDLAGTHYSNASSRLESLLEKKNVPPYFHYLSGLAYEGLQEWEKALQQLEIYDDLRRKK